MPSTTRIAQAILLGQAGFAAGFLSGYAVSATLLGLEAVYEIERRYAPQGE